MGNDIYTFHFYNFGGTFGIARLITGWLATVVAAIDMKVITLWKLFLSFHNVSSGSWPCVQHDALPLRKEAVRVLRHLHPHALPKTR